MAEWLWAGFHRFRIVLEGNIEHDGSGGVRPVNLAFFLHTF
jgi:hypothetical protein